MWAALVIIDVQNRTVRRNFSLSRKKINKMKNPSTMKMSLCPKKENAKGAHKTCVWWAPAQKTYKTTIRVVVVFLLCPSRVSLYNWKRFWANPPQGFRNIINPFFFFVLSSLFFSSSRRGAQCHNDVSGMQVYIYKYRKKKGLARTAKRSGGGTAISQWNGE